MTGRLDCNQCGGRGATRFHVARCELRAAVLEDVAEMAASLDHPPTTAELAELHAHMSGTFADGVVTARAIKAVLGLGWRPSIRPTWEVQR